MTISSNLVKYWLSISVFFSFDISAVTWSIKLLRYVTLLINKYDDYGASDKSISDRNIPSV